MRTAIAAALIACIRARLQLQQTRTAVLGGVLTPRIAATILPAALASSVRQRSPPTWRIWRRRRRRGDRGGAASRASSRRRTRALGGGERQTAARAPAAEQQKQRQEKKKSKAEQREDLCVAARRGCRS